MLSGAPDKAHGRRKFRDAEATQPVLAAEGGAFIGAMYGVEEKAHKLGLHGDALREYRQEHIRPIVRDFQRWLDAVHPTLLPSEPVAAAIGYYKNHGAARFRFVPSGAVFTGELHRISAVPRAHQQKLWVNCLKLRAVPHQL